MPDLALLSALAITLLADRHVRSNAVEPASLSPPILFRKQTNNNSSSLILILGNAPDRNPAWILAFRRFSAHENQKLMGNFLLNISLETSCSSPKRSTKHHRGSASLQLQFALDSLESVARHSRLHFAIALPVHESPLAACILIKKYA
jgi:hypothetical protein